MTYIVEAHSEAALSILQRLAELNLVTLSPQNGAKQPQAITKQNGTSATPSMPVQQTQSEVTPPQKNLVPLRQQSLAGTISPDTTAKLHKHTEQIRNEWDHRI
jgi:hypothetical protein